MKKLSFLTLAVLLSSVCNFGLSQELKLNDLEYFETQGVNVLVYNNLFTGGFNDEKNAGIELIHHGVRTAQGGAVRLSSTPEQWDLVPAIPTRTVDRASNAIESTLRYEDYDFDSRVVVTAKGKGIEISVYLDKPLPGILEGNAGFNLEFLPSQYWGKTYLMDEHPHLFPRYVVGNTVTKPNSEKLKQKRFEIDDEPCPTLKGNGPCPGSSMPGIGRSIVSVPKPQEGGSNMHPILKRNVFRIMVDVDKAEKSLKTFASNFKKCADGEQDDHLADVEANIKRLDLDLCTLFSDTYVMGQRYWKRHNISVIQCLHRAFFNLNRFLTGMDRLRQALSDQEKPVVGLEGLFMDWFRFKKSILDMRRAMASVQHRRKRGI